nr:MAG TPA: hypothetical protein [Caudoviricetes sp.]
MYINNLFIFYLSKFEFYLLFLYLNLQKVYFITCLKNYFIFNFSAKSYNFSAVSKAILSILVFPFLTSATVDQGTSAPLAIALVLISLFNNFSICSLI